MLYKLSYGINCLVGKKQRRGFNLCRLYPLCPTFDAHVQSRKYTHARLLILRSTPVRESIQLTTISCSNFGSIRVRTCKPPFQIIFLSRCDATFFSMLVVPVKPSSQPYCNPPSSSDLTGVNKTKADTATSSPSR